MNDKIRRFVFLTALLTVLPAGAFQVDILGNTTGDPGGEFADYSSLSGNNVGDWGTSVVEDGVVSLSAGKTNLAGEASAAGFNNGGSYVGAGTEINFTEGSAGNDQAAAFLKGIYLSFQLNSTAFNSDFVTIDSLALSLYRNGSAASTFFQLAYDADENGFDAGDLLGSVVHVTNTSEFTVSANISGFATTQQEVRLYFWGGTVFGANTHLYEVSADYSLSDGSTNGAWTVFTNYNFGVEANHFTVEGTTPRAGGRLELRLDAEDGPSIGAVDISHTGSWDHYMEFDTVLDQTVSGTHTLYMRPVDSLRVGGTPFSIGAFRFEHQDPERSLPYEADTDGDGSPTLLEYAAGTHPESEEPAPLRLAVNESAGTNGMYELELRLRADASLRHAVLISEDLESWQEIVLTFADGTWQTDDTGITVSESVPEGDGLYTVRLWNRFAQDVLFVRRSVETVEGDLHVYGSPPGYETANDFNPSPYYEFYVQKVSELNSTNLSEVTNWEEPFAWFTKCIDYVDDNPENLMKYYAKFIGSWSHTYCNFELDAHTPIVVKISRKDDCDPAPSGPITAAAAHPARKVDSCEIINGDVYVTMSQPAFVSVDIDGQLDGRDAPRVQENVWNESGYPYRYESNGVHAVSIFANPFIDKPDMNDPGVVTVAPGTLPPSPDGSWTTLYFEPGIHHFSMTNGVVRDWKLNDFYELESNVDIYIPGDAVVFGNFTDDNDYQLLENVRIYGHGTMCGTHMPHGDIAVTVDPDYVESPQNGRRLRMFHVTKAVNVTLEGVTIADQPYHGCYIFGRNADDAPNYIKWVKVISWRVNNDSMQVTQNGYIEDCFMRHQDDAVYVGGLGLRRCVFWCDVNGTPLRCTSITKERASDYPAEMQKKPLVVEDVDCIYGRGIFSVGAVIKSGGALAASTYSDGVPNTGQHVVFRNIRYEDPRPRKTLIHFDATLGSTPTGDWAGIRFENLSMDFPQINGVPDGLIGNEGTDIRYFTFDDVFINGERVDAEYVNDPARFETHNAYDMIFK